RRGRRALQALGLQARLHRRLQGRADRPAQAPQPPRPGERMIRLRRSELAVPASNERMIQKAAQSDADLVFLDLEDAVAPAGKEDARELAIRSLNELHWGHRVRAVRVNDAQTRWAHDDVIEIVTRAGQNLD